MLGLTNSINSSPNSVAKLLLILDWKEVLNTALPLESNWVKPSNKSPSVLPPACCLTISNKAGFSTPSTSPALVKVDIISPVAKSICSIFILAISEGLNPPR